MRMMTGRRGPRNRGKSKGIPSLWITAGGTGNTAKWNRDYHAMFLKPVLGLDWWWWSSKRYFHHQRRAARKRLQHLGGGDAGGLSHLCWSQANCRWRVQGSRHGWSEDRQLTQVPVNRTSEWPAWLKSSAWAEEEPGWRRHDKLGTRGSVQSGCHK